MFLFSDLTDLFFGNKAELELGPGLDKTHEVDPELTIGPTCSCVSSTRKIVDAHFAGMRQIIYVLKSETEILNTGNVAGRGKNELGEKRETHEVDLELTKRSTCSCASSTRKILEVHIAGM